MSGFLNRILALDRIAECYDSRPKGADVMGFLDFLIDYWGIRPNLIGEERLERIPREGPLLIVANHPIGGWEGIAITRLLLKIRPDLKAITNELLTRMPEFDPVFIGVNVLTGSAEAGNIGGVRKAYSHLKSGGALLMFPSGKVASVNVRKRRVEEHPWNRTCGRLARAGDVTCLPIHVGGGNSRLFYAVSMIHPKLRALMLPRELANKRDFELKLTIGEPIEPMELRLLDTDHDVTNYLRLSTELLPLGGDAAADESRLQFDTVSPADPSAAEHLATMAHCRLIESDPFEVYCASYEELGPLMREIGIAREITFRAAGEGTGNAVDSDRFDPHYLHIFVWDKEEKRIAGGYRIGRPQEIADRFGVDAIYARTLFNFDREYLERIGPSLEMGRSFVYPDYQRHPKLLDLLWRGIGAYVARNPEFYMLFGAVSVSKEYSSFARALIAESMVAAFSADPGLRESVRPIIPLKVSGKPWSKELLASMNHVSALNKLVGRCDPEKTLPTLLRHYLALNGRFVCFSVNRVFNDSLDGLILVDLRQMPARHLKRYMGKEYYENLVEKWGPRSGKETRDDAK